MNMMISLKIFFLFITRHDLLCKLPVWSSIDVLVDDDVLTC